ncbi:MAG: phosphate ABC transporter permease PstA [Clostridiaceae bacterium]
MNKNRKLKDIIMYGLIYLSAFITFGVLIWILVYIVSNGIGALNFKFIFSDAKDGGILPMIISTIYVVILSIVISTPIGIGAAIYLVEYAKPGKLVRLIRFATESLAGIPSIIFGLFGMLFFVTTLKLRFSILSGALTLSIMVLPTIVRTTEEALKSVPDIFREGSYGLGASKLRTIVKIVLPSAVPGILSAVILSIGRIVGETAALMFTAGSVPRVPSSVMNSGRTLSVHLYLLVKEGISFEGAFATATILVVFVAILNWIAASIAKIFKRI